MEPITHCGRCPNAAGLAIDLIEEGEVGGEEASLAEAHGQGEGSFLCCWAYCPLIPVSVRG